MGLYNMIFGQSANADELLTAIRLTRDDFYRYRDCYKDDDDMIAVYTRGGGGNRECWADWSSSDCKDGDHCNQCVVTIQNKLRQHQLYHDDKDDDFDCTYATFYFKIPEGVDLSTIDPEINRDELWQIFLAALKDQSIKNS